MSFIFEQVNLSAASNTTIRTVGTGNKAIYDINIANKNSGDATVNISIEFGGNTTFMEYAVVIPQGTPLVRTKEMFPSTAVIKVESDLANVDVTLAGIEEVA